MIWRLVAMALGAWVVASVQPAHAQQAPPEKAGPALNWTRQPGAEPCIGSVELASRIEARVKKKIFVPAPEAIVAVEGYVAPNPSGGFRASIAMSDGQGLLYGSRQLETQGACSELNDGLVFVIAVTLRPEPGSVTGIALPENVASALDALFGEEPTEPDPAAFPAAPQPASTPASLPAPAPASVPPERPKTLQRSASTVRAFIEAAGMLQRGLQPEVGLGGGGGLRFQIERVGSLSLHGTLFAQSRLDVDDVSDDGARGNADFRARMLSLGYCTPGLLGGGMLGLEACAAGRIGDVIASAHDFDGANNSERSSLFVALGLAARVTLELSANVVLALAAGPELHLARPVFEYATRTGPTDDARDVELYKTDPLGGAAELSIAFALF
jgi:hypothetical protein